MPIDRMDRCWPAFCILVRKVKHAIDTRVIPLRIITPREKERSRSCRPNSHKFDIARRVARMLLKQPIKRRKLPSRSVTTFPLDNGLIVYRRYRREVVRFRPGCHRNGKARDTLSRAVSSSREYFLHFHI